MKEGQHSSVVISALIFQLSTDSDFSTGRGLARAELGSPAALRWLGGGAYIAPLPNFRTNWRSEEPEAAIESSQREDSNTILKFS